MTMPSADKAPSLKRIPAAWKEADKEEAFWREHRDELLEQHAEKFVAVHKGAVVAASDSLPEVLSLLQAKGISPREAWIKFVTSNPRHTLL